MKKKINLIIRLSDSQIISLGQRALAKSGGETSSQLASVRCSVGKHRSVRVQRIGAGSGSVGREFAGARMETSAARPRSARPWLPVGALRVFGDVCSYLQMFAANGMGRGAPAGAEDMRGWEKGAPSPKAFGGESEIQV